MALSLLTSLLSTSDRQPPTIDLRFELLTRNSQLSTFSFLKES
jgi:hypothetical protein